MKNAIFKAVLILIAGICSWSLCHAQDLVEVGAILPLSGEASSMGVACQNGMQMAWDEFPKELQDKVKLRFEDDALKPANTVSAYRKLVNVEKVKAVVAFSSGTSLAISPLADAQKVPLLAIASDENVVKGRSHVVNFWVTPDMEAQATMPELRKHGYKKIARISTIQSGIEAVSRAFDRANKGEVALVLDEQYSAETKDFRPYITKLASRTDVDATMLLLMPGHLALFAKQARAAGIKHPFFGGEILTDTNEVRLAEGALSGAWYVDAKDASEQFQKKYAKRFPNASSYTSANGYDAIMLLGEAVKNGNTSSESINTFIHTVKDFSGALGTYSATDDNRFTLPAAIKVVP